MVCCDVKVLKKGPLKQKQVQHLKSLAIGYHQPFGYFLCTLDRVRKGEVICEYIGVVKAFDGEDETMSFEDWATSKGREVVICTDKYANEGRFILGTTPSGKEHQANCTTKLITNSATVRCFVVAIKTLNKGDIMYMYYGPGYDTLAEQFSYKKNITDIWPELELLDLAKCQQLLE
jgi:hypothetical protein